MADYGIKFSMSDNEASADVWGIKFKIRSGEELDLIQEIFFINEYNFSAARDCTVFDIGMNVGLASLSFAKKPFVKQVYSFEPFDIPFRRAVENFRMNPGIAPKIHPFHFGLGSGNQTQSVYAEELNTVGVSIKGTAQGIKHDISVRDAGEEIGSRIDSRTANICKVDCEGSEFAIFDSLERADLFPSIDMFMIEWHKWWDTSKTQDDLLAPLLKAGYFALDMTSPSNPMVGYICAVRGR